MLGLQSVLIFFLSTDFQVNRGDKKITKPRLEKYGSSAQMKWESSSPSYNNRVLHFCRHRLLCHLSITTTVYFCVVTNHIVPWIFGFGQWLDIQPHHAVTWTNNVLMSVRHFWHILMKSYLTFDLFFQGNIFESVVCKLSAICSLPSQSIITVSSSVRAGLAAWNDIMLMSSNGSFFHVTGLL